VDSRLLAPLAVLLELNLTLNKLLVLGTPIVNALAVFAGEFDEAILGHRSVLSVRLYVSRNGEKNTPNLQKCKKIGVKPWFSVFIRKFFP
jgi:hypothetical protein